MALPPGARLGSLEIIGPLGAGGMGEVYRARDTRLGREVAVEILPAGFTDDPDRLARFEREAKTLAALNHPHIAQIYGLEESVGIRALVMELVDGDDLSQLIARGPLALPQVIAIARQIAEALETAHERGIIHRDLKPANLKVRSDGTVKVLDFGLAKERAGQSSGAFDPTISASTPMTQQGVVMGTPGYMSPEQASGLTVDARTDIWAFGCVLYEMVTGRHPFRGNTSIETLASVIKADPDWSALAALPPAVQGVIRRCLQKDARQRFHHMADVRFALEDALVAPATAQPAAAVVAAGRSWWPVVAAAAIAAALGVAATILLRRTPSVPAPSVVRFQITPPPEQPFDGRPTGFNLAISPDGRTVIYHATVRDTVQLIRRDLDSLKTVPIQGTERAQSPAFSPDGSQLVFYVSGAVRTVPLTGGTPLVVCEWPGLVPTLAWLDSGEIVIGGFQELLTVPERGGTPKRVMAPDPSRDEGGFFGVAPLPGGGIITTILPASGGRSRRRVAVLPRGATAAKVVLDDAGAGLYTAGHLFYSQRGTITAVPFSRDRLEVTGEPVVLEADAQNQAHVARDGTYLALSATPANVNLQFGTELEWLTPEGRPNRTFAGNLEIARHPRISPDGKRLAVVTGGLNGGAIWIYDLVGSSQPIKITFRAGAGLPTWRPDGRAVAFTLGSLAQLGIYSVATDGSQMEPEKLLEQYPATPEDWRPDGSALLYQGVNARSGADLMLLDRASGQTRAWLQTQFNEGEARFSPDGRWVAYTSDQTGRYEIWVRPFAAAAPLVRVSSDGGHEPRWSRDGKQIVFQSADKLMIAAVESADTMRMAPPRVLPDSKVTPFNPFYRRSYDIASDGRLIAAQSTGALPHGEIVVVLHALDALTAKK